MPPNPPPCGRFGGMQTNQASWNVQQGRETESPSTQLQPPTGAFVGASWLALLAGVTSYLIGLWNALMQLNERGYYFAVLINGLFAAVSLQKSVRDRAQGIPVTGIYYGLCWLSLGISILLLVVGLWNATIALSEKGFYAMAFTLSLFASVAVQKNIRDVAPSRATAIKELEREIAA